MNPRIRKQALLPFGFWLILIALTACGGTPSEADIEATVQARIQEKQAEDAALEVKAQNMAKAMVEATAQAMPTATPVPPTPTPEPTPTLPSSISVLSNAKTAMAKLDAYHYDGSMTFTVIGEGTKIEIPVTIEGDFKAPDKIREKMSVSMFGMQFETGYIEIGDQTYAKEPMSDWMATDMAQATNPNQFWSGDDSLLDIPLLAEPALEEIDGVMVYYMKFDTAAMTEGSTDMTSFLNFIGEGGDDLPENMAIEYWVEVQSQYLKKFIISADVPVDEDDTEDSLFSGFGADAGSTGSITMEFTLSAFNENMPAIVAPTIN